MMFRGKGRGPEQLRGFVFYMSFIVVGGTLVSCAGQTSSGVLERDADTYFISVQTAPVPLGGGAADSRRAAYKEAKEHCLQQDKKMTIMGEVAGPVTVNLTFKCARSDEQGAK
ncbi:MAG: hypothetical protein A2V62_06620 [Nitrospirae bacterium RBG_19FT_COMBO_58_9]|nr:MAG: hypothetical protein A2V62_06620 [Nitrospirae bacterium RBG_19FT_COMBO_58_9]